MIASNHACFFNYLYIFELFSDVNAEIRFLKMKIWRNHVIKTSLIV